MSQNLEGVGDSASNFADGLSKARQALTQFHLSILKPRITYTLRLRLSHNML